MQRNRYNDSTHTSRGYSELYNKARTALILAVVAGLSIRGCQMIEGDGNSSRPEAPEQLEAFEQCTTRPNITGGEPRLIRLTPDHHAHELDDGHEEPVVAAAFIHTVTTSDNSLSSIADCYFPTTEIGLQSILAANPSIANPDFIIPGQEIKIWITHFETLISAEDRFLEEIAEVTGFNVEILADINDVATDGVIPKGAKIKIPRQETLLPGEIAEVVVAGSTYSGIAAKHKADIILLQSSNAMLATDLQPGQIVVVPTGDRGTLPPDASDPAGNKPTPPSEELPPEVQMREFVRTYTQYAEAVEAEYGIPAALVLAMAIHESDYGRSILAEDGNNFHGLKANGLWGNRPRIAKKTEEFYSQQQLNAAREQGLEIEMIDVNDGVFHVYVVDNFRRYDSVEAGFMGLGEKLSKEGNYPDAFETDDPYEFLSRLVDDKGPTYATDPEYRTAVSDKVRRVEQMLFDEELSVTITTEAVAELEESVAARIEDVILTEEGYSRFVESIDRSFLEEATSKYTYDPNKNEVPQEKAELFIWHYTTVYYNGRGRQITSPIGNVADVSHFLESTKNNGVGIQYFIDRSGNTYQLTDADTRVSHIPPHSSVSIGVEIESDTQDNITTAQYESAAYLAAYTIMTQNLLADNEIDEVLYGHAELREIDRQTDPSLNVRSDFMASESAALRDKVKALIIQIR